MTAVPCPTLDEKADAMAGLIDRLPEVRGSYSADASLSNVTWFRVGGKAEVVFRPVDVEDLCAFIKGKPTDVPVTVLGVGSNVLIRDGGLPGVTIRLTRKMARVTVDGDLIHAGAGILDANVALAAADAGLSGLEFLIGIPGTIGGGLRMNAGAFGGEFKDVLVSAKAISPDGVLHDLSVEDLGLSYRHSNIPEDWVFVSATFKGVPGDEDKIRARMDEIRTEREAAQPLRVRTGGSTFANPEGGRAWELIDRAGCRGLQIGGAKVSEKHCNFLINTGEASAADIEALGEEVRRRVLENSGVELRWEIRRIGKTAIDEGGMA